MCATGEPISRNPRICGLGVAAARLAFLFLVVADVVSYTAIFLKMKHTLEIAISIVVFALAVFGQEKPPLTIEVRSAFVWGEDSAQGVTSSIIEDPLTGNSIPKLSYDRIEVSTRMGFERLGIARVGMLLGITATVINGTESDITVNGGGISINGHAESLVSLISGDKRVKVRDANNDEKAVHLEQIGCFKSGFLSSNNLFGPEQSQVLSVSAKSSLAVTAVVKSESAYSVRCSIEGCYPTGTMRYYITVKNHDYVFEMPGRSATQCGK